MNPTDLLRKGAETGDLNKIREAVRQGVDINADLSGYFTGGEWGFRAIHFAAQNGHVDAIQLLKDLDADINIRCNNGYTALHVAVQHFYWYSEPIHTLLKIGTDPNARSKSSQTPLHILIDAQSKNEATKLLLKLKGGSDEVAKLLLEYGADPDLGTMGKTVTEYAAEKIGKEYASLLNLTKAIHLLEGQYYPAMIAYLDIALRYCPDDPLALFLKAEALKNSNRADEAVDFFKQVLAKQMSENWITNEFHLTTLCHLVASLLEKPDELVLADAKTLADYLDKATVLLSQIRNVKLEHIRMVAETYFLLGNYYPKKAFSYEANYAYDEALKHIDLFCNTIPKFKSDAEAFSAKRDIDQLRDKVLIAKYKNIDPFLMEVDLLLKQNKYIESLDRINELLATDPKHIEAKNYKSDILKKLSKVIAIPTQKLSTELFTLVKNNDLDNVKQIIQENRAYLLNICNAEFDTVLELACQKQYWQMLEYFLEMRPAISESYFDQIFLECLKGFQHSYTDNQMINHYVSLLTHCDVNKLSNTDVVTYLGHMYELEGFAGRNASVKEIQDSQGNQVSIVEDGEALVGWSTDRFLPLRIRVLFTILLEIEKGIPTLPDGFNKNYCVKKLKQELLVELESLRAHRDATLVHCAPEEHGVKLRLQKAHANNIALKISQLKQSDEYSYNTGYDTHSVYVSFINLKDIIIRADNLGSGIGTHEGFYASQLNPDTIQVKPKLIACSSPQKFAQKDKAVMDYLLDIIQAKFLTAEVALAKIYRTIPGSSHLPNNPWPLIEIQLHGHCVFMSHNVGFRIRLDGTSDCAKLSEWFLFEEKQRVGNPKMVVQRTNNHNNPNQHWAKSSELLKQNSSSKSEEEDNNASPIASRSSF